MYHVSFLFKFLFCCTVSEEGCSKVEEEYENQNVDHFRQDDWDAGCDPGEGDHPNQDGSTAGELQLKLKQVSCEMIGYQNAVSDSDGK